MHRYTFVERGEKDMCPIDSKCHIRDLWYDFLGEILREIRAGERLGVTV